MHLTLPTIESIGIFNSNIAAKNIGVSKDRKTTMFELELPLCEGGISYIESEEAEIAPNMIICAKPGQTRHTKFPFMCYYVHLILPDGDLRDLLMKTPVFLKTNRYESYLRLFQTMYEHHNTLFEADEIHVQSTVLKLIYSLIREYHAPSVGPNTSVAGYAAIQNAIEYIDRNLASDLSLHTLADYAGFSPIHFHNCFKAVTGKTPHDYVEERRIKKAVNLLITTNSTLTEIAYECGFSSQSYFSFAFKRITGLTPRDYAKKIFSEYEF